MSTIKRNPMNRPRALAAAAFLLLASAAPAAAQFYDAPIPRRAVLRDLIAQGFEPTSRLSFDGRLYIVEGYTARGRKVRLLIDAYEGDVVRRTPLVDVDVRVRPDIRVRPFDRFEEDEEAEIERAEPPRRQRQAARTEPPATAPLPPVRPRAITPPETVPLPPQAVPVPEAPVQLETRAPRIEVPALPEVDAPAIPPAELAGPDGVIEAPPEADLVD